MRRETRMLPSKDKYTYRGFNRKQIFLNKRCRIINKFNFFGKQDLNPADSVAAQHCSMLLYWQRESAMPCAGAYDVEAEWNNPEFPGRKGESGHHD